MFTISKKLKSALAGGLVLTVGCLMHLDAGGRACEKWFIDNPDAIDKDLEVHEWGTFTSVNGDQGVHLDWRPLAGPSDLPSFVYGTDNKKEGLRHEKYYAGERCDPDLGQIRCKKCMVGSIRMETPVIYFYTKKPKEVRVKVDFPKGQVTEWYPQARQVRKGIEWGRIQLLPGEKITYPHDGNDSHYYPAREVDAVPLRICGKNGKQHENLLFYRGVGVFEPPLTAAGDANKLTLKNSLKEPIPAWFVFENRDGTIRWQQGKGALVKTADAALHDTSNTELKELLKALETSLVKQGLFSKEAKAMIKTWKDSWFEDGLRILYLVPRAETDRQLPLRVLPRPAKTIRVMVGRSEIMTKSDQANFISLLRAYTPGDVKSVNVLRNGVRQYGRFTDALLTLAEQNVQDDARPEAQALRERIHAVRESGLLDDTKSTR